MGGPSSWNITTKSTNNLETGQESTRTGQDIDKVPYGPVSDSMTERPSGTVCRTLSLKVYPQFDLADIPERIRLGETPKIRELYVTFWS